MNALTPWTRTRNPWQELESLQDRVNRVFGLSLPTFNASETVAWLPATDLKEVEGEYLLTSELPGMTANDVQIDVDKDMLVLKGEKKTEREEEEGRWHLLERTNGSFERSFALPRAVDVEKIKAEFADGVLTVHLPKKKEAMGRKIDIVKK